MPPTPLDDDLDRHLVGRQLRQRIAQRLGAALHVRLDDDLHGRDLAIAHLRQHVFELRRALLRELGVAELALTIQRDFARLALAFDHEQLVAGIRRARQAEHHDRHRRTGFGHRLTVLVEHRTHAAEFLAGDDLVARLQRAALDQHRRDCAAAFLHARLDHDAGRQAIARRFQLEHVRLQQDGVEQLVDALRRYAPTRSRTSCRRPSASGSTLCFARSFLHLLRSRHRPCRSW